MSGIFAQWIAPVYLRFGDGHPLAVTGPAEARSLLSGHWPWRAGPHYATAVTYCDLALAGPGWLALAREAFIAAALEAGLFGGHSTDDLKFVSGSPGIEANGLAAE
ncbi:DUF982 domain-containing protein [Martelella endophytica]|nr:DUF982 domain-containing protein [Martelella endophytica]